MTLSPFDYTKSIDSKSEKLPIDDYNAFIVNRALSFGYDTCLFSNAMNMYPDLDKQMQYDFLYYGIPAKRRFNKWIKCEKTEGIDIIMEYYNCSLQKTIEYATILNEEQKKELKRILDKGGKTK